MYIKQWLEESLQERTCYLIYKGVFGTKINYIEKQVGETVYQIPTGKTDLYDEKLYKQYYNQLLEYEWDIELEDLMRRYLNMGAKVQDHYSGSHYVKGVNNKLATYILAVFNNIVKEKCT